MKIRVIWEGRTRDEHWRALQDDYISRISHFADLKVEEGRKRTGTRAAKQGRLTPSEERLLGKARKSFMVLLDPRGEQWTSEKFAQWLARQETQGIRELAFLVGGAEGFSDVFRQQASLLLSLSPMTLTHDWARTLLLEQIYRSFTILRGHPYPR